MHYNKINRDERGPRGEVAKLPRDSEINNNYDRGYNNIVSAGLGAVNEIQYFHGRFHYE